MDWAPSNRAKQILMDSVDCPDNRAAIGAVVSAPPASSAARPSTRVANAPQKQRHNLAAPRFLKWDPEPMMQKLYGRIATALLAIGGLLWASTFLLAWTPLPSWLAHGRFMPSFFLPAPGVLVGFAVGLLVGRPAPDAATTIRSADDAPLLPRTLQTALALSGTFAVTLVVLAGAQSGELHAPAAALLVICGLAIILLTIHGLEAVRSNDGVGVESHWGGLGGGLSGWRISRGAVLLLLLAFFCAAAAGLSFPSALKDAASPNVAKPAAPDGHGLAGPAGKSKP